MHQRVGCLLSAVLFLSACQLTLPDQSSAPRHSTTTPTRTHATTQTPTQSDGQASGTTTTTTPATVPTTTVTAPPKDSVAIAGSILVDAHYLLAKGAGTLSGDASSQVVAIGKQAFRVLATDVPVGTQLPASGMQVRALSMLTGKPYGDPVSSDAQGAFKLYVPDTEQANVLLVAQVPASTDLRLTYNLITSPKTPDSQVIDEDTGLVSRYLRSSLVDLMKDVLTHDLNQALSDNHVQVPPSLAGILNDRLGRIKQTASDAGVATMTDAQTRALAQRLGDIIVARLDAGKIPVRNSNELAIPTLVKLLGEVRQAATTKLAADPDFFSKQDYYKQAATASDAILKPSDVGEFLVSHYFSNRSPFFGQVDPVFTSLDLDLAEKNRLFDAIDGVLVALDFVLLTQPQVLDDLVQGIKDFKP